jgi:pimeloyl-ACP methyl ester carboxylesterase
MPPVPASLPVQVLWGDRDPALPFAMTADFRAWAPGAKLHRISACGHWTQQERPDLVNSLVLKLLEGVDRGPAGADGGL